MTAERKRLDDCRQSQIPWKLWGPYLSERQWGTVREDYSPNGDAWNSFPHDHARSRAYRWGEDGLAGISDQDQHLCFALALWNGRDGILKERLFGLTNSEGNHGEDVKECYYYLDNTPTHSYMKYLYKYPQAAFPYEKLLATNRQRSRHDPEYELLDTGIFSEDRYFDVFVEYAKAGPRDILVRITAHNRGPEPATIHLLPTLWFRNDWSAWIANSNRASQKPSICQIKGPEMITMAEANHSALGAYLWYCEGSVPLYFTENETNHLRLFPGQPNESPFVKDGINDRVVAGTINSVNPANRGTKAAAHYQQLIAPGESFTIRTRLTSTISARPSEIFGESFEQIFTERVREADDFYQALTPLRVDSDTALVLRQALAGMLWTKQFFFFDADNWLDEHNSNPMHKGYQHSRNSEWFHLLNRDIISMPDKWEYPWYAAWDLAFHAVPLALVDADYAKEQMKLMLNSVYLHPNGQMPAYEWSFSDVNPPVHALATLFLHRTEQALGQPTDIDFLRSTFNKLTVNFTWWANRKDRYGKNVFEGGFLGLDNIGIFDRSAPLPTGGHLEQADGTAWMALFSQNMAELAVELSAHDPTYEDMVQKFTEQFYYISAALNRTGDDGMWDEEDGFYYDILRFPDGTCTRLKIRSLVGLLPFCAATVIEEWQRQKIPKAMAALTERLRRIPELLTTIHPTGTGHLGVNNRGLLAVVRPEHLRRILARLLDENEFLSPHGIRSISKYHEQHPYVFRVLDQEFRLQYEPAESTTAMFGGNSNWRGPVWMPMNMIILRALMNYFLYYGESFTIECPTGSGRMMNLYEVAQEISNRLIGLFTRNSSGQRPVFGKNEKLQNDPLWRDHVLFYEYFHGDTGAGLGASHQTGWTGLVAKFIQLFGCLDPNRALAGGKLTGFSTPTPAEK